MNEDPTQIPYKNENGRLAGRIAWISGATSGIGEAAAHLFASEGAAVALTGRRLEKSEATAEAIRGKGGRALALQCDVADEAAVRDSIEKTVEAFGALDYAVDGIRCNAVCPGITDTPMLREHLDSTGDPEGTLRKRLERVPMGVPLSPLDVAKSLLYFSCEDSAGITGTTLTIDCGYLTAAEWSQPGKTAFND